MFSACRKGLSLLPLRCSSAAFSICNNFFHNTHLHFKMLLYFQNTSILAVVLEKSQLQLPIRRLSPSIIITVWGNSFTGIQNEMSLLYTGCLEAHECWRLCEGKRFMMTGNQVKISVNQEKFSSTSSLFPSSIFVLHLSNWIMTPAELTYLWF